MMEPDFRQGFAELEKRDLSFDAWMFHPQLPELIDLARQFPDTRIILDHLGGPIGVDRYADPAQGFDDWKKSMAEVAGCENVVLKIGSLNMSYSGVDATNADRPMTSKELAECQRSHILTAIDLFGPDRCMFESNFPVDMVSTSYVLLWNGFKRVTQGFSPSERADMFHDVAQRAYRIQP